MTNKELQKQIKYKKIIAHIIFWAAVVLFNTFIFSVSSGNYNWVFKATVFILPFEMFAVYLTLYLFIPKYLLKNNYTEFVLYSLLVAIIIGVVVRLLYIYVLVPYLGNETRILYIKDKISSNYFKAVFWNYAFFNLYVEIYSIVGVATAIKLFKHWLKNQRVKNELEKQNIKSELALLRNQVNPHFLFNTLNNIDTLITKDKEKASDSIIKLSEIMRYMLYEANSEKVPLEKEIDYLKSYISLQQLRLKKQNFVEFTIQGDYKGRTISPMLFISFVENAFKHGSKITDSPGIRIELIINKQNIQFKITNYFTDNKNKDKTEGIGLSNVNRRLELLYPDKHQLKITKDKGKFKTYLLLEN